MTTTNPGLRQEPNRLARMATGAGEQRGADCAYPELRPVAAYRQGCRCGRCEAAERERERARAYWAANREKIAQRRQERRGDDAYLTRERELRSAAARRTFDAYRAATPARVTGPYSAAEDETILTWQGRVVDLAIELGRSYQSVSWRRRVLLGATGRETGR